MELSSLKLSRAKSRSGAKRIEWFSKYCSHLAGDFRRCGFQPRKQLGRDRMLHLRT